MTSRADAGQGRRQRRPGRSSRQGTRRADDLVHLDPRAGPLARRHRRSPWSPTARTRSEATSSLQFCDIATKKFARSPNVRRGRPARPPGPGLAAGRQGPAVRPKRPRRLARGARDLALGRGQRKATALTGPGYLSRLLAGRALHRRDQDHSFGNDLVILDARPARSPARHQRRRILGAGLVAGRRLDRVPPHRRPDRGPRARPADGTAPAWTVDDIIDLTEVSGLDGDSRPELVRPGRPATGARPRRDAVRIDGPSAPRASRPGAGRPRRTVPPATYLERLAERTAAVGTVLCLGLDPDPAALPAASAADLAGVERFAASRRSRPRCPYAAAVKPNLAFYEAFGSAGLAALERMRAAHPGRTSRVVIDAKRGDIGTTAARQAVALFDGLGADAVTVNPYLGAEAIGPLLERPIGSPTCCAAPRTRARPSSRTSWSRRDAAAGAPAGAASTRASPASRPAGVRAAPSGWSSAPPRPTSSAAIRRIAPGLAFLVPGIGAQGGDDRAGPRGRARRRPHRQAAGGRRAARQRVARDRPARPRTRGARPTPSSASRPPPPTGRDGSLCYPSRRAASAASHASDRSPDQHTDADTRAPRARHHPRDRPAHPRPGQAAGRRRVARQEHQGIPQGVLRHPGIGRRRRHLAAARLPPPAAPTTAAAAPASAAVRPRSPPRRGRRSAAPVAARGRAAAGHAAPSLPAPAAAAPTSRADAGRTD